MSRFAIVTLLSTTLFSAMLSAQESRWFEVEMIIFSQTPASPLQEQFGESVTPIKPGRAYDLLTPLFQPDISGLLQNLPLCDSKPTFEPDLPLTLPAITTLCIVETQPQPWQQHNLFEPRYVNSQLPYPAQLPVVITAKGEHQNRPYLADAASLQLGDIAAKLKRQSGISLLLHTSWRQAPVTERRAIASRWFAGKNYTASHDYWGQPLDTQQSNNSLALTPVLPDTSVMPAATNGQQLELISNIDALLQQLTATGQLPDAANSTTPDVNNKDSLALRNLPQQVWQLDGLFKLHLDHYLFVNTEFNLRRPSADGLQTIFVQQSRRVISGEIHYLDHPHLGIILQIRRYEPPTENGTDETTATNLITE